MCSCLFILGVCLILFYGKYGNNNEVIMVIINMMIIMLIYMDIYIGVYFI